MRAIYSYGVAGVILVVAAVWLGSGVFVAGGNGPGQGEKPVVDLLTGQDKPADPALKAEADAKMAEAAATTKAAQEAKAAADAAAKALHEANSAEARTKLEEELKTKEAALKAAQKEADKAQAEFAAVQDEATKLKSELEAVNTIADRSAVGEGETVALQSVRTQTFTVQPFQIEVPLRGRTKAKSIVTVTPETSGVVTAVKVSKGDRVNPGQVVCTLEEGDRAAAVAQANASLAQAKQQYDTNAELRQKGLAASNTANQFEVALKAAQAAYDQAVTELDRTKVTTEVAGVVQDPIANVGNMLTPGQPCVTVVELDPMLFVGTVPESRMALAKTGLPAKVETVTGKSADGTVTYLSAIADDSTRSFPVEISVPNPDGKLLSGTTATATVNLGSVPAQLLPQSVLTLNDNGDLGVRAVEDGTVKFYPVTILSDAREGMWVTGLPAKIDVITVGQDFVTAGQKVDATNVSTDTAASDTGSEGAAS